MEIFLDLGISVGITMIYKDGKIEVLKKRFKDWYDTKEKVFVKKIMVDKQICMQYENDEVKKYSKTRFKEKINVYKFAKWINAIAMQEPIKKVAIENVSGSNNHFSMVQMNIIFNILKGALIGYFSTKNIIVDDSLTAKAVSKFREQNKFTKSDKIDSIIVAILHNKDNEELLKKLLNKIKENQ